MGIINTAASDSHSAAVWLAVRELESAMAK